MYQQMTAGNHISSCVKLQPSAATLRVFCFRGVAMIAVLVVIVVFLVIGQSAYQRGLAVIDQADTKSGAGIGCAMAMLAILGIGAATLAILASMMSGL